MAAKTVFKQQCPSCEAMVPIKDATLIGRKIDCPKCKYRFVVEDPGTPEVDEVEEAPPARAKGDKGNGKAATARNKTRRRDEDYGDDDDAPRPKAKGGDSQKKLYIGLGLAGAALVLLVVAVVVIMNNKSDSSNTVANSNPGFTPKRSTSTDDSDDEDDAKKNNTPTAVVSGADISNLLPGDSQMVLNLVVPEFLRTPIGNTAFSTPGAYRSSLLRSHLGFADKDVDRAILARSFSDNWLWLVVRSNANKAFDRKAVENALHLTKPTGKTAMKGDYLVGQNNWLAASPVLQFGAPDSSGPAAPGSRPVYVKFIDDHTLVMADKAPMQKFLANGGKFDLKTQPPVPAAAKDDDDNSDDNSSQNNNQGKGGQGGKRPLGPGVQGPGGPGMMFGPGVGGPPGLPNVQQPKVEEKVQTTSYLTVDPALKSVLDRVETDPDPKTDPFAATVAVDMSQGAAVLKPIMDLVKVQTQANVIGAALRVKGSTLSSEVMLDCANEDIAQECQKQIHDRIQALFPQIASLTDKQVTGKFGEPKAPKTQRTTPGFGNRPFGPGMMGPGMGGPPGGAGGMNEMMQRMMQMRQQRGGMGMGPGMGPPGMGPGMGPPGMGPGMGPPGFGGTNPFSKGRGQQASKDDDKSSKVVFTISLEPPKTVGVQTDVPMDTVVSKLLTDWLGNFWLDVKSQTDMANAGRHLDLLAGALKSYVEQHKEFPAGTWQRPVRPGLEIPYPPDQRVSWMVTLLPFLGHPDMASSLAVQKSWYDPDNTSVARAVIPEFLDPANGQQSWRVQNRHFDMLAPGATHFVGMAGIGLDAAEAEFRKDPKNAAKLGIFGYDSATKLDAVKDGAENTIAIIEVPAEYRGPWLAGGGSTVRGVPETHSVAPFVCTEYKGQKGTFAIMADCTVRFIPATIKDDDFKALCTIAGKERINVDRVAPKVESVKTAELKAQRVAAEDVRAPIQPTTPKTTLKPILRPEKLPSDARTRAVILKQVVLAYHNYYDVHKGPPAKSEDLESLVEYDPRILTAWKTGDIVVYWNANFTKMVDGTSNTVLSYYKEVPQNGGLVAMADGSVKTMTAQQFAAAPKAGK